MHEQIDVRDCGEGLPAISIVVIGRNEGERLARCLKSLKQIRRVEVREVIYVDSASTDGSPLLAARLGANTLAVHSDRPTAALGRNAGWRCATADLILFLDGDTVLHPDFLRVAAEALSGSATLACVWGHRREINSERSVYSRVLDLDWIYAPGLVEFCGGDALFRRDALVESGGFDEGLIAGEEPELCRRLRALGYGILHIDVPMTGHDLQITRWIQYWRRATRAGHAYAEVSERFRGSADPFWTLDRRRNIMRGGFWLTSLTLALGASIRYGVLPLLGWSAILTLMTLRTAWKARWKSNDRWAVILYGLHSHLQQVPILVGQLQYEMTKGRRSARKLIEYKERRAD
jgi:glycosyltransferase involved in cell wall biosynthesis